MIKQKNLNLRTEKAAEYNAFSQVLCWSYPPQKGWFTWKGSLKSGVAAGELLQYVAHKAKILQFSILSLLNFPKLQTLQLWKPNFISNIYFLSYLEIVICDLNGREKWDFCLLCTAWWPQFIPWEKCQEQTNIFFFPSLCSTHLFKAQTHQSHHSTRCLHSGWKLLKKV